MVRYTPLLSEPALEYEERHDGWGSTVPDNASQRSPSSFWRAAHAADFTVCFVLVACLISVSSLALNMAISHSVQGITPLPEKLIFPNSCIGLENAILRDTAPPKPIVSFPLLIAQINSSEPSTVYLQQPHSLTSFGMVYPEDREFIVDSEVSTIAQFRALDFGLEQCIATLEIPSPAAIQNKSSKSILSSNDGCALGIWYLDAPESIQPHTLPWAVRPRRLNQLTTFSVHQGHNLLESPPFACASRTLFAFELEYSSAGCYLQFRQDKKTPRLGEPRNDVSTIAQFRALDFGLEQCIATLEIPSPAAIQNKSSKSILSSNDGCALGIWYLDAPESIQPHTLPWAVRPRRLNQLTTFSVHQGHNLLESPPFACASRTLFAFELEYSSAGCYLQFRQDKKTPRLAFYIIQHPSTGQRTIEFDDADLSG